MRQDRFLMGILIGIGVLVVLSLALYFLRQQSSNYVAEDTPQGVVQNYATALQKQDYQRAYNYLAEGSTKPDLAAFRRSLAQQDSGISSSSLEIDDVTSTGNDATVSVTLVRSAGGLIAEISRQPGSALLTRQNGVWKITNMTYPYWGYDWYQQPPNQIKPVPGNP